MAISVSEIARKLKITNTELIEKAESLGFDIGKKAIKINENTANQIIEKIREFEKGKKGRDKMDKLKETFLKSETKKTTQKETDEEKIVYIDKTVIVHEFAKKLSMPVVKVISCLMNNGIMANLNQTIDFEIASIISEELGHKAILQEEGIIETQNQTIKKELKNLIREKHRR